MAYSSETTIIESPTDNVVVPFKYSDKSHVNISLDGDLIDPADYVWTGEYTIEMDVVMTIGQVLIVFRTTPLDDLFVLFVAGQLEAEDLNDACSQLLFVAQEIYDGSAAAIEVAANILQYVADVEDDANDAAAANVAAQAALADILALGPHVTAFNSRTGNITAVANDISDATTEGKAILQGASYTAIRSLLSLGTAALINVGTAASQILQLNGSAQIPAVDGSLVTLVKSPFVDIADNVSIGSFINATYDNTYFTQSGGYSEIVAHWRLLSQTTAGTWTITISSTNGTSPVTLAVTPASVAATSYEARLYIMNANEAGIKARPYEFVMTTAAGVVFCHIMGDMSGSPTGPINWLRIAASAGLHDGGVCSIKGRL